MELFKRLGRIGWLLGMLLIVPAVRAQGTSDQILYAVANDGSGYQIFTVNVDDGEKTQIGIVHKDGSDAGWSPDGKFIYLLDNNPDRPKLTLIEAETGQRQVFPDQLEDVNCALPFEWSPNSEWIAYTTQSDSRRVRKIFNPSSGETKVLSDVTPDFGDMTWSADGRYLTYRTTPQPENYMWAVWDIQHQQTMTLLNVVPWDSPQWSPKENRIVYTSADSHKLVIYDVTDGTQQQYNSADIGKWSPDGKFLALYLKDNNQGISLSVIDVLAKATVKFDGGMGATTNASDATWSSDGHYLAVATRNTDHDSKIAIYILDVEKRKIQPTKIDVRDYELFMWSPVGSHLAFSADSEISDGFSSVWLFDADNHQSHDYPVKIKPLFYGYGQTLYWSATGRYMTIQADSGIALLDWTSEKLFPINTTTLTFSHPHWSPDGTKIAFDSNGNDIYIFTPDDKALRNITNTPDEMETFLGWRGDKNSETLINCGEG